MKFCMLIAAFLTLGIIDHSIAINPKYDFPDSIIAGKGNGFGHLSGKMNDLCISGHHWESRRYEDSAFAPDPPMYITLNKKKAIDARQLILEEAKKFRIVLINEAHHRPEHRLFTKSLLPGLRALGFDIFMAEGIRFKNGLDKRSYPVSTDGHYLSEPVYGSLIRYAKKLRYEIGGYEANWKKGWDDSVKLDQYGSIKYISYEPKDSIVLIYDEKGLKTTILTSVREKEQARNILAMIKKHPRSKLVIHVGYGHLYEDGHMMGGQLRALLQGEDLLTIDQTMLMDRVPIIDSLTQNSVPRNTPFVLRDAISNTYFNAGTAADYSIVNKLQHDSLNRPGYLFEDIEQRKPYYIPEDRRTDCPCLFVAYYENEYEKEKEKAIAADIIYLQSAGVIRPLLLHKGRYQVIKKNKEGKLSRFAYRQ